MSRLPVTVEAPAGSSLPEGRVAPAAPDGDRAITLIPSAAYVETELAAEYGRVPPAFLPVGHRRLYELQLQVVGADSKVWLSLPASFKVPETDRAWLARAGVRILQIPDGLTLSDSLRFALDLIGEIGAGLRILHGDTLILDAPLARTDVVAVGEPQDGYAWGRLSALDGDADPNRVLAGYFAFSDVAEFRRCLCMAQGSFLDAVARYHRVHPLAEVRVGRWLDFGHLQTYYRARCGVSIQREFNELDIDFRRIRKSGRDGAKIRAEADWFEHLPASLRSYTPALLGQGLRSDGRPWYSLEYLPLPTLHELYVFGSLASGTWRGILGACAEFLVDCRQTARAMSGAPVAGEPALRDLIARKTDERLGAFLRQRGMSAGARWRYAGTPLPPLEEIARITAQAVGGDPARHRSIVHGDFCFTNIFYDFRTQRVRVIDPRGSLDGRHNSVLGDWRYDLAKLSHSLVGGYDHILAGRYRLEGFDERDARLEFPEDDAFGRQRELADAIVVESMTPWDTEIIAIVVHLFLSMLPLHSDRPDRQRAFLANALRLFHDHFVRR